MSGKNKRGQKMRYVGEVVGGGPRYFQILRAAGAGKEEYDIYDDDERRGEDELHR